MVLNSSCFLYNVTHLSDVPLASEILIQLVWEGVVLNTRVDGMFAHHFPGGLSSEPLTYAYHLWTGCQLPSVWKAASLLQFIEKSFNYFIFHQLFFLPRTSPRVKVLKLFTGFFCFLDESLGELKVPSFSCLHAFLKVAVSCVAALCTALAGPAHRAECLRGRRQGWLCPLLLSLFGPRSHILCCCAFIWGLRWVVTVRWSLLVS